MGGLAYKYFTYFFILSGLGKYSIGITYYYDPKVVISPLLYFYWFLMRYTAARGTKN